MTRWDKPAGDDEETQTGNKTKPLNPAKSPESTGDDRGMMGGWVDGGMDSAWLVFFFFLPEGEKCPRS